MSPRKKQIHALADDGEGGLTLVSVDSDSSRVQDVPGVPSGEDWTASAVAALTLLMDRTDGWFRAAPDKDGKTNHFKWKFNSTRWPNHYVYYSCPVGRWSEGICGLYMKVRQVDEGVRKPTYDTYYVPL